MTGSSLPGWRRAFALLLALSLAACAVPGASSQAPEASHERIAAQPCLVWTPPPLAIKYEQKAIVVGSPVNMPPSVKGGTPTNYSISPGLPAGLSFNTLTGVISGTPQAPSVSQTFTVAAWNCGGTVRTALSFPVHAWAPPVLVLNATATDPDGDPLTFEWRVTDGSLSSLTGATVNWTMTQGGGLHFAYVQVGDGHGGYVEKRIVVSTEDFGTLGTVTAGHTIAAPAQPFVDGSIARGHIRQGMDWDDPPGTYGGSRKVYPARLWARGMEATPPFTPLTPWVQADIKGDIALPKIPAGHEIDTECSWDGGATTFGCSFGATGEDEIAGGRAKTDYTGMDFQNTNLLEVAGNVTLADGTPCGGRNYVFGTDVAPVVSVTETATGAVISPRSAWDVNAWGDYWVPTLLTPAERPLSATFTVTCEAATATRVVTLPTFSGYPSDDVFFVDVQIPNERPQVTSLSAKLAGVEVSLPQGAPPALPSDGIFDPERFFSYKGVDSRKSACQYYLAIGAVAGCDPAGNIIGGTTLDIWKQQNFMAPYNVQPEVTAIFVNEVDLGLTRVHKGTRVGPNHLSYNICNYPGPADGSQAAIDAAIQGAVDDVNMVACVAMDYSVSPGVNNDQPFIKYYIFGPSGELLPSVNLDGRREKFVPGVCVGCHGGEHYAGRYPEDGTGVANVGASYLPFDVDNFGFSSAAGLTETDQLANNKQLNEWLLESNPKPGMADLINGWYASGGVVPDETYVPVSYQATAYQEAYYFDVIKPYCRTCHVAYGGAFNSEDADTFYDGYLWGAACGGRNQPFRDNSMPNSRVTLDRFAQLGGASEMTTYFVDRWAASGGTWVKTCNPPEPTDIWPPN